MKNILCRQCSDVMPADEVTAHFTDRHPALLSKVFRMIEVALKWTCPGCGARQQDSVHPDEGPFTSCTCDSCGKSFSDEQLSETDAQAWDEARAAALDFFFTGRNPVDSPTTVR